MKLPTFYCTTELWSIYRTITVTHGTHFVRNIPTLKVLIHHGARLDVGNRDSETPIMAVEREGRNSVYQYLRLYNLENRKQTFKPLDSRFTFFNSDRVRKAIAATALTSGGISQDENDNKMPNLEEGPPIQPARKQIY